jgi:hypothetical protein
MPHPTEAMGGAPHVNDALFELCRALARDLTGSRAGAAVLGGKPLGEGREAQLALRDHVYERYFSKWRGVAGRRQPHLEDPNGHPRFVARLRAATEGTRCWQGGWRVTRRGEGWWFVSDGKLHLFVNDSALLRGRLDGRGPVEVSLPCARPAIAPHFFYWLSPKGPVLKHRAFVRIYLHITAPLAVTLVRTLMTEGARFRFDAKLPSHPQLYRRADAAVMYVGRDDVARALDVALRLRRRARAGFRDETPLFAHRVAPGVALAESQAERGLERRESFGQQRCGWVAAAVLASVGRLAPDDWPHAVARRFAAEGVDPDRPFARRLSPAVLEAAVP